MSIGEEISKAEIVQNPGKKILFLIAWCEMALTMFGDLGRMVGIQGIRYSGCREGCVRQ